MLLTARRAQRKLTLASVNANEEAKEVLSEIESRCVAQGDITHVGALQQNTINLLRSMEYKVVELNNDSYNISWNFEDTSDAQFVQIMQQFDMSEHQHSNMRKLQTVIIALCIVIVLLLLSIGTMGFVIYNTKQVGLVALVDTPPSSPDIPGYDPDAIIPPDDDKVQKLNEKLDMGKMCINMVSKVTFKNSYASGYVNIVNDEANNYPQFVTITLDNNGMQIYQSGLIEVGKTIPYAMLEVELPTGEYECTATFSQVNPETNKICGQAAAKILVVMQG